MDMCVWLDCYIHYSGFFWLSLLAFLERKVACRLGKVKLNRGLKEAGAFPVFKCEVHFLSVREGGNNRPPFIFLNHCARMQSYTQAQVYEYTSIQYVF